MKKKVVSKTLLTETLCNSFGRKAEIWFSYAATCLPEPCLAVQDCASIHLCFLNRISLVDQNSPRSVIILQWLRCLILIVNVQYCKINHDSFPFLFTWRVSEKIHQLILPCFCWATCYYVLAYLMDIAAAKVWTIITLGYPSFMNYGI